MLRCILSNIYNQYLIFKSSIVFYPFHQIKLPGREGSWMGDYATCHVVDAILRTPRDSR